MSSTNTWATMLNWLISHGKLAEIMPYHLTLDLNLDKFFSIVNTNNSVDHLRQNYHVTEMSFDNSWFLAKWALFLGLTDFRKKG